MLFYADNSTGDARFSAIMSAAQVRRLKLVSEVDKAIFCKNWDSWGLTFRTMSKIGVIGRVKQSCFKNAAFSTGGSGTLEKYFCSTKHRSSLKENCSHFWAEALNHQLLPFVSVQKRTVRILNNPILTDRLETSGSTKGLSFSLFYTVWYTRSPLRNCLK